MNKSERKLYRVLASMKNRCYNKNEPGYKNYGGRGIKVCDEWRNSYEAFESWALSHGYAEGLSIERIDVNGNYCPENCKWATQLEQCNNMRRNIRVTYLGKTQTLAQWAKELGKLYESLRDSYYRGTFPPTEENAHRRRNKLIEYQGKCLTAVQWAKELGIPYENIKHKIKRGTFPPTEENAHKRRNKPIIYKGKSMTIKQWAEELGVTYSAMKNRVFRGQFPPKE